MKLQFERAERLDKAGRVTGCVYRVHRESGFLKSVVARADGGLELDSGNLMDRGAIKVRQEVPALVKTLEAWLASREDFIALHTYSRGPYGGGQRYVVELPGGRREKELSADETAAYSITIRPEQPTGEAFPRPLGVGATEDGLVALRLVAVADWIHAVLRRDTVLLTQFDGDLLGFVSWPWRRSVGRIALPPVRSGKRFPRNGMAEVCSQGLFPVDAQLIIFAARDGAIGRARKAPNRPKAPRGQPGKEGRGLWAAKP
jgi:hypothetical protein